MENEKEIIGIIGKENLSKIRKAIRDYKIKEDDIINIALKMDGSVYGTFDMKKKDNKLGLSCAKLSTAWASYQLANNLS